MKPCRARVVALSSTAFGHRCIEEALAVTPAVGMAGILTTAAEIPISYAPRPIHIATHARFDDVAARTGCEVVTLSGRPTTASYLQILREWRPDLLLVLGWYYLVPNAVREIAPLGCLGIHSSLLPKYRGGAPIPWAIINGESVTGVTLFHLEDEVDAGDVVAQESFPIGPMDTCADVIERATGASVAMLRSVLAVVASGRAPRIPQRHEEATVVPQRSVADGLTDWPAGVAAVHNFVRAQTRPYPGAFTWLGASRITVWKAAPTPLPASGPPGRFIAEPGGEAILVSCGDAQLRVSELGMPDGRSVSGAQFLAALGSAIQPVFGGPE